MSFYPWIYQLHSLDNDFGSTILSILTIYSEHGDILFHLKYYLSSCCSLSLGSKKRRLLLAMRSAHFSKNGRVGRGCVGVRHYFRVTLYGRKDQSIDPSVGNPTPAKANFVTVSVSEFYLVSATDILYGRLCGFYMILNFVGTQNSIIQLWECTRDNRTMVVDTILQTRVQV